MREEPTGTVSPTHAWETTKRDGERLILRTSVEWTDGHSLFRRREDGGDEVIILLHRVFS
jgi:hypothetical protein